MELSAFKPNERIVEIKHPGDETKNIGIRITIMAISDPRMKGIRRSIIDMRNKLELRGKQFKSEDIEENQYNLIFTAMTGWEWYNPTGQKGDKGFNEDAELTYKGQKKPPFTKAVVVEILRDHEWLLNQLSEEISNEKAFFEGSGTI